MGIPSPGKTMSIRSAMTGAAMTGKNDATESSVFRMPKMRPRTLAGSSSWRDVWAGMAIRA